jgi:hypothetical protein
VDVPLDVTGTMPVVTVGTSMAVAASIGGTEWQEGITLPRALLGAGGLTLTASVGHLAPQFALAEALLDFPAWTPDALAVTASLVPEMAFGVYDLPVGRRRLSATDTLTLAHTRALASVALLRDYTDASSGLLWYPRSQYYAPYVSLWLNLFGLFVGTRMPAVLPNAHRSVDSALLVSSDVDGLASECCAMRGGRRGEVGEWGSGGRGWWGVRGTRTLGAPQRGLLPVHIVRVPMVVVMPWQTTWRNAAATQLQRDVNDALALGQTYQDWWVLVFSRPHHPAVLRPGLCVRVGCVWIGVCNEGPVWVRCPCQVLGVPAAPGSGRGIQPAQCLLGCSQRGVLLNFSALPGLPAPAVLPGPGGQCVRTCTGCCCRGRVAPVLVLAPCRVLPSLHAEQGPHGAAQSHSRPGWYTLVCLNRETNVPSPPPPTLAVACVLCVCVCAARHSFVLGVSPGAHGLHRLPGQWLAGVHGRASPRSARSLLGARPSVHQPARTQVGSLCGSGRELGLSPTPYAFLAPGTGIGW